jgi:hypothetical protein
MLLGAACGLASGAVCSVPFLCNCCADGGLLQTFPLMNIVFGRLTSDFNKYFLPEPTITEHTFKASVNRFSWVLLPSILERQLTCCPQALFLRSLPD